MEAKITRVIRPAPAVVVPAVGSAGFATPAALPTPAVQHDADLRVGGELAAEIAEEVWLVGGHDDGPRGTGEPGSTLKQRDPRRLNVQHLAWCAL
jgi:hypothetical protein